MCKFFKNKKYNILIAILLLILSICVYIILSNLQNENMPSREIVNSFTSFFIGIISIIGIIFNLRDNEKLRNESKEIKMYEIDQRNTKNNNIKLLISHEVFNNINTLKEYNSKINIEDTSILMKPKCFNTAWKSLYMNLPEVFKENELEPLIKFYEEIDLLLDDKNWLKLNNAEPEGTFKNGRLKVNVFTEEGLKEISHHKKFIKKHVERSLSTEKDLKFFKYDK